MRVLLANKFFYDHGGPEAVLFLTRDLLQARGHDVIDFSMQDARNRPSPYAAYFSPNVDLQSVRPTPSSLMTALRFLDSREAASRLRKLVRDHRPDIAHLHSINHQLTPSIIRVLRDEGVPAVMTLHDYKLACPAYTMLARGRVCESCGGGRYYRAVTSSCRGPVRSALLAAESYLQHDVLRSYRGISLFLSPSRFLADKFRQMGFKHPIDVLPNPTTAQAHAGDSAAPRDPHVLFVGRAVPEKGLRTLCAAAVTSGVRVKIAGDGPQLSELTAEFGAQHNIDFLGRLDPARAQQLIRQATAVAVPSEWYENQPMVILEAFANGTPVIASAIGGNAELVTEGETGLLHPPGDVDALAAKLRWALDHGDGMARMGQRARTFAAAFSPDSYYERLFAIYGHVLDASARASSAPPRAAVTGSRR